MPEDRPTYLASVPPAEAREAAHRALDEWIDARAARVCYVHELREVISALSDEDLAKALAGIGQIDARLEIAAAELHSAQTVAVERRVWEREHAEERILHAVFGQDGGAE